MLSLVQGVYVDCIGSSNLGPTLGSNILLHCQRKFQAGVQREGCLQKATHRASTGLGNMVLDEVYKTSVKTLIG